MSPLDPAEDSLLYWRARILFSILFAALLLCTLAVISGVAVAIEENAWGLVILDLFGYGLCIFLIFNRRMRYEARASVTLSMFYVIGIAVIASVGPLSGGVAWLFAFAVLVGVLLGRKPAILAICLNAATLLFFVWFFAKLGNSHDVPFFKTREAMVAAGVNFLVLNAIVAVSVASLVKSLAATIEKKNAIAQRLENEGMALIRSKLELESEIGERKKAQADLQQSEKKYRQVVENATVGIFVIQNGRYRYVNGRGAEICGISREEILKGELYGFVHPDDRKACADRVNHRKQGRATDELLEHRIVEGSGRTKWVEVRGVGILWDGSHASMCFVNDITARKEMETRLQQTQKLESIGTLAGGIAHDFNNILFPILGYAELTLEDLPEVSPLRGNVSEIINGAMRATDLVNQILTFSRQDRTKNKVVRLQSVIQEALEFLRATIPSSIEVQTEIRSSGSIVRADPTQLHQIVINLATNAFHAIQDTGGNINISLEEIQLRSADLPDKSMVQGGYACLTVRDTGMGMDHKTMARVFEPYFTTKEPGKGTGMGLSVVHGIVKNAGGAIKLNSRQGKGTVVNVYLPVFKGDLEPEKIQAAAFQQRGSGRILLVDDEKAIVLMVKQMLERLGYSVVSHFDSQEALEVFRADCHGFDLVISDMTMPKMTGDKLASELINIRPDIPILLCTGFSERLNPRMAEAIGIKGVLMKPVIKSELTKAVRKALEIDSS